jgi:hypothetical protein
VHWCQPTQRSDDGLNAKQLAIAASANEQAATGVAAISNGCAQVEVGSESEFG